jgi:hypothetical protein
MADSFTFEEALQPPEMPSEGQSFTFEEATQAPEPVQQPVQEQSFTFEEAVGAAPETQQVPTAEEAEAEGVLRSVYDVPLKFAEGATRIVRAGVELFGAESAAAKNIEGVEDYLASLMSAGSKRDSAEIARIFKEAEDKGVAANLAAAVEAFATAPIDTVSSLLGSAAPFILASVGASLAGLGTLGAAAVTGTLGAGVGAGLIKGEIYDAVYEQLKKDGATDEEAAKRAENAQDYFGENPDMIAAGAGLGVLGSITGIDKAGARTILNRVAGKAAEASAREAAKKAPVEGGAQTAAQTAAAAARKKVLEEAQRTAAKGYLGQALRTGATEAITEGLQGGQEQLAKNIALQREGYDVPTWRGVSGQAAFEAIAGGFGGAGVGTVEVRAAKKKVAVDEALTRLTERRLQEERDAEAERQAILMRTPGGVERLTLTEEERNARVEAETERIMNERGIGRTDALAIAEQQVDTETSRKEEELPGVSTLTVDADIDALARDFLDRGVYTDPQEALREARNTILDQRVSDEAADAEANVGASSTVATVEPTVGVSPTVVSEPDVSVAGQPESEATTEVDGRGVDDTGDVVDQTVGGEGEPAPAVELVGGLVERQDVTQLDEAGQQSYLQQINDAMNSLLSETGRRPRKGSAKRDQYDALVEEAQSLAAASPSPEVQAVYDTINTKNTGDAIVESAEDAKAAADLANPKDGKRPKVTKKEPTPAQLQRRQEQKSRSRRNVEREQSLVSALDNVVNNAEAELEGLSGDQLTSRIDVIRERVQEAVDNLYDFMNSNEVRGTATYQRLKQVLARPDLAPFAKRAAAARPNISESRAVQNATSIEANPELYSFTGADGTRSALRKIMKIGNKFEQRLARKLLKYTKNVTLLINDVDSPLPDLFGKPSIQSQLARARGMYIEFPKNQGGGKFIILNGTSFGPDNGVNISTLLHEALHAAVNSRYDYAITSFKEITDNLDRGVADEREELLRAVGDLVALSNEAAAAYFEALADGTVSAALRARVESTAEVIDGETTFNIFEDVREFIAYGLSDPVFQEFLMTLPALDTKQRFGGLKRFVRSIMRMLNIDPDNTNAFLDLVDITDSVLLSPDPELIGTDITISLAKAPLTPAEEQSQRIAREKATRRTQRNRNARNAIADLRQLQLLRQPTVALSDLYYGVQPSLRKFFLTFHTNDALANSAKDKGLLGVAKITNLIARMHGTTTEMLRKGNDLLSTIYRAASLDPTLMPRVENLMWTVTQMASDLSKPIDPATTTDPVVSAMWDDLGPVGRAEYRRIYRYYADMARMYNVYLDTQVREIPLSSMDKQNLMIKIREIYEPGSVIDPYFALLRQGDYWVRHEVRKGEWEVFFFQTFSEQQNAIRFFAKERNMSAKKLKEEQSILQFGSNLSELRKKDNSEIVKSMFDMVDKLEFEKPAEGGTGTPKTEAEIRNQLKDAIYQLYLLTMPDQSIRKQFIKRKNVIGFDVDAMSVLARSITAHSNQLPRLKYGRRIQNEADVLREQVKNQPELQPFSEAIDERIAVEFPSSFDQTQLQKIGEFFGSALLRASYIHFLSGISSALLQPMQLVMVGFNVLGTRHGFVAASKVLMKYLLTPWNLFGVVRDNEDGTKSYVAPTLRQSRKIKMSAEMREDIEKAMRMGVSENTIATELVDRRIQTLEEFGTNKQKIKRAALTLVGGLMHTTERMSREIMLATSYELSLEENLKAGMPRTEAREKAIQQATLDVFDGMGNMAQYNRPPIMRGPLGKLAFQFMIFPLYISFFLFTNFRRMLPYLNKEGKKEAATLFFTTMGSVWVVAGASGLPLYSTVMGLMGSMVKALDDEDDEIIERDLRDRDFETWFRTVKLPELLSWVEAFGIDANNATAVADRGLLNYATGLDFASRLSLNNMFFRERPEYTSSKDEVISLVSSRAGPAWSMLLAYAQAWDDYNNGDPRRALERTMPAFVRNIMLMDKYASEGVKNFRGGEVIAKDKLALGILVGQVIGFRPELLANEQQLAFAVSKGMQKLKNERMRLLNRVENAYKRNSLSAMNSVMEDIQKFNAKYGRLENIGLPPDTIRESLKRRLKIDVKSIGGIPDNKATWQLYGQAVLNTQRQKENRLK